MYVVLKLSKQTSVECRDPCDGKSEVEISSLLAKSSECDRSEQREERERFLI